MTVMPALSVFEFEDAPVRVIDRDGAPWFVLADVCRVLEIINPSDAASRLDDDERDTLGNVEGIAGMTLGNTEGHSRGGPRSITIINESGLYVLVLTSRKAAAKRFRKWVTSVVLPTIRRTGRFEFDDHAGIRMPQPGTPLTAMRPDELNAYARMLHEARNIHGRNAAAELWRRFGLPDLNGGAVISEAHTDEDPLGPLRHLMRFAAGNGLTVADLVRTGQTDEIAARRLERCGLRLSPQNHPDGVAIAHGHPYLVEVFRLTLWGDGWRRVIANIPGVWPARNAIMLDGAQRRAVIVPRKVVFEAMASQR